MELIVTKGMSVSQIKDLICKELADEHNRHIPKSRSDFLCALIVY